MRNAPRAFLWIALAFICVTIGQLRGTTPVAAQSGLQVDKASIGGTVINAGVVLKPISPASTC